MHTRSSRCHYGGTSPADTSILLGITLTLAPRERQVRKEIEETLHHFWEMTSYISNTIIFILAGVIIGRMLVRQGSSFTGADVGWLLLFYVWLNVSRVIMVALLFPLLRKLGYGLDVRNAAAQPGVC